MAGNVIPMNAWRGKLSEGRNGYKRTLGNLMICLQHVPGLGDSIRFNVFTGRVEWNGCPLQDEDIVDIRLLIEETGFEPITSDVLPAVIRHAHDNAYDPVRNYLDGLKWDRKSRLDSWLSHYMGAPEHDILSVFGSKFLIGAVARIYNPGCQMDNMLVFEGKQGAGKTTAVSALFGREYMISSISDFKSKEASIALQGRWCAEIAELAALKKTDITDVKKFITETVDQYRPVHGKNMIDRDRRCVFIGTTNERQYLKDATGNRRFWPVPCGDVKVGELAADRDQLWAEAVARYRKGEAWWIEDKAQLAQAETIQSDRSMQDPWGELIDAWLDAPENQTITFVTSARVLADALRVDRARMNRADEMRVADHLDKRGWKHVRRTPAPGQKRVWGYDRP